MTYVLGANGLLASLAKLLQSLVVCPQIRLAAHKDDRDLGAEVGDLGEPLLVDDTC